MQHGSKIDPNIIQNSFKRNPKSIQHWSKHDPTIIRKSFKVDPIIQKLTNTSQIKKTTKKVEGASFRVQSNAYFVPIAPENIDLEAEMLKLQTELKRTQGFLIGIQKKLTNERFMKNAPQKVIDLER